jgi:hypothetical protein
MTFKPEDHMTDLNKNARNPRWYLETKWRLVWFKDEHPTGKINTEVLNVSPVLVKATILDGDGVAIATGHGTAIAKANAVWAGREIEKAETAAIGRALAHAGYGTQFTGEDDTDSLADSPVSRQPANPTPPATASPASMPDMPMGGGVFANGAPLAPTSPATASSVDVAPDGKHPQIGMLDMPRLWRKSSVDGRTHFDNLIRKLLTELHTISVSSSEDEVLTAIRMYYASAEGVR